MKKIRGDKPVGVTIYLYMEISQGKSLCIHLYLKQAKCHVLLFLFSPFSSTKLENRRAKQVLSGRGDWHQWEGKDGRERG
jgi:hypothetical protein